MRVSLAFAVLALSACTSSSSPEEVELEAKRTMFHEHMANSYEFTWRQSCECTQETAGPMRITVSNGAITSAAYVETSLPVPANVRQHLLTIDGIFDKIQDAIDDDAHMVTVVYDTELGFPSSVAVDYDELVADEELSLTITNLVPIAQGCGVAGLVPCG